ncbi:nucleoporin NUP82, partial [Lecanoromycetidae sp. Uapishka_2]
MPKVISYTPRWLSRPSPGFELFNTTKSLQPTSHAGRRGSVQQIVNGGDLCMLKDDYEELEATPTKRPRPSGVGESLSVDDDGPEDLSYRILKVPVSEQIRQLSVSPNGDLLAIATSHTVHIALLPDSSFLGQLPNKAIKLRVYTIGPTTHVLSQSQITNLLWHPFGVGGSCLVTITADAVVRLWEFNQDQRWSSDSPSLAIDLKKLVTGSSEEESFAPNKFGRNRSFSADAVGLEVASACFGGAGFSDESPWSAMTLWLAMKGGDLYALCPLLPSKWQPSSTLIPSLSTSIVAKAALHEDIDPEESRQCRDQYDWIQILDGQDPMLVSGERETSPEIEVYSRPSHRSAVPRLQGPFQLFSEDIDEDLELSDIHVIAGKLDAGDLLDEDDADLEEEWMDEEGLSVSTICLMTRSGRVYVSLDLEGVEGQWLPREKPSSLLPTPNDPYLVVLEGLDTLTSNDKLDLEWPTFSSDPNSRYSFFTTHSRGVYFFSLDPWIQTFDKELKSNETKGAPFRMNIIKNGPGSLRERLLSFEQDESSVSSSLVTACLPMEDSDLGYFVLTSVNGHPHAATLDQPQPHYSPAVKLETQGDEMPEMGKLEIASARETYQPSNDFWKGSSLPTFVKDHVHARHQRMVKGEIRLSTAALDLMTEAHRVTSEETHRLGLAAADLFRRCERLQEELRDQIKRASEVAQHTERIAGEDADTYLDRTENLINRAKEASQFGEQENGHDTHSIPFDLRRAKETQVMKLLERQSALIEAEQIRLERLNMAAV